MTDTTIPTELSSIPSDVQAALDAGTALAEPHALDRNGRFYSITVPAAAQHRVVDLEHYLNDHRPTPRRKTGVYAVHDAQSFIDYVGKHGHGPDVTELWADITSQTVIGVINAHAGGAVGEPGWGDHRVQLRLHKTPAWKAWVDVNRKPMPQVDFAEHIEDRRLDVTAPDAATLTEISRTFKAKKSVQFHESRHLSTGQVQLQYHEEIDAKAGPKGEVEIPEAFDLALQPFEGSDPYLMRARLRFDISTGKLLITYVLDRPEEILRSAFSDVLDAIKNGVNAPLFLGTSA